MPWHTHTHMHMLKNPSHTHTHTQSRHTLKTQKRCSHRRHMLQKNTAQHTSYKNWSAYESSHFYTPMACR